MAKVHFIDVTNRDGVQAARIEMSKFQRTMVNYYLGQLGVYQSEFAFPFIWHEENYVNANVELAEMGAMGDLVLEGWCRAVVGDVEKSLQNTGVKHLNVSISTSDQMIDGKFRGKVDRQGVIDMMVDAVHAALDGGALTVGANAEDSSRSDMDYLDPLCPRGQGRRRVPRALLRHAWAWKARTASISASTPWPVRPGSTSSCTATTTWAWPSPTLSPGPRRRSTPGSMSTSTPRSMASASARATPTCSPASWPSSSPAASAMSSRSATTSNLDMAWKLGHYVADAFGLPVPINQVGIGANAFAHESGIHADGMLKDRHNYEIYDYELLGRTQWSYWPTGRVITTGEYGGMNGLRHVYEQMGITFEDSDAALQILNLVQALNAHNQMQLTPDELRFVAEYPRQVHKLLSLSIPDPAEHIGVLREQDLVEVHAFQRQRQRQRRNGHAARARWCTRPGPKVRRAGSLVSPVPDRQMR